MTEYNVLQYDQLELRYVTEIPNGIGGWSVVASNPDRIDVDQRQPFFALYGRRWDRIGWVWLADFHLNIDLRIQENLTLLLWEIIRSKGITLHWSCKPFLKQENFQPPATER